MIISAIACDVACRLPTELGQDNPSDSYHSIVSAIKEIAESRRWDPRSTSAKELARKAKNNPCVFLEVVVDPALDHQVRDTAYHILRYVGKEKEASRRIAVDLLTHQSDEIRLSGITMLWSGEPEENEYVARYVGLLLNDPKDLVASYAAETIGFVGNTGSVEAIKRAIMRGANADVKKCLISMARLDPQSAREYAPRFLNSSDNNKINGAISALIIAKDDRHVRSVLDLISEDYEELLGVTTKYVKDFGDVNQRQLMVDRLHKLMNDFNTRPPDIREIIAKTLASQGDRLVLSRIPSWMESKDTFYRSLAKKVLGYYAPMFESQYNPNATHEERKKLANKLRALIPGEKR